MPDTNTPATPDVPDAPRPTTRRIPPEKIAAARAKIQSAAADLAPYMQRVDDARRKHMRRVSRRDFDSIHRAEALARANPRFRPGFVAIDDFAACLGNSEGLEALRDPLAALCAGIDDTLLVEETNAADSASAVYKVIQVAARMKDPEAQAAEADLASRRAKRGRPNKAKAPQGASTPVAAASATSLLALPGPSGSGPDTSRA